MTTLSIFFRKALKVSDEPNYAIAMQAGLHPTLLSKILNNAVPLRRLDKRVIAVARVLGIPENEAFADGE